MKFIALMILSLSFSAFSQELVTCVNSKNLDSMAFSFYKTKNSDQIKFVAYDSKTNQSIDGNNDYIKVSGMKNRTDATFVIESQIHNNVLVEGYLGKNRKGQFDAKLAVYKCDKPDENGNIYCPRKYLFNNVSCRKIDLEFMKTMLTQTSGEIGTVDDFSLPE